MAPRLSIKGKGIIKPGLWALKSYRNRLPAQLVPRKTSLKDMAAFDHSYYQGLLVEIGNLKQFATFIPNQDKNKLFLNRKLGEVSSLTVFYSFTYDHILNKARTIDVTWFNERKMPEMFFEVEHSTDMNNSLLKYSELRDFYSKFFIVASGIREREFQSKLSVNAFSPIKSRTAFMSYEKVSEWHSETFKITGIEKGFGF